MTKFFARRKFNFIDITTSALGGMCATNNRPLLLAVVLVVGALISTIFESCGGEKP